MTFLKMHMKRRNLRYFSLLILTLAFSVTKAQDKKLVDGIAAVVGNEIILVSDIQMQYQQFIRQNRANAEDINECFVFNELLYEKLLIHQAEIDSVVIDDQEIEMNLDRRLSMLEEQMNGKQNVEKYYEKSYIEIKEEMKPLMRNQLTSQRMQGTIISDIDVTPGEVQEFFNGLNTDSLPIINTEVEIAQIVKYPEVSREAEEDAIKRLKKLKERIESGTSFRSMAVIYSEDPGSSKNGGLYEGIKRGQFVPEFEAVSFNLKRGEISDPFKTEYGYHIVQLLEKNGEQLDLRHILIKPKITQDDLTEAKNFLDSLRVSIEAGEMSFEKAAREYSEDEKTKFNGGILLNYASGDTKWQTNNLDRQLYSSITGLKVGDISTPQFMRSEDQKEAFRLILLRKKIEPHKANVVEDYQFIKGLALQGKQKETMDLWLEERIKETYIKIYPDIFDCELNDIWSKVVKDNNY